MILKWVAMVAAPIVASPKDAGPMAVAVLEGVIN